MTPDLGTSADPAALIPGSPPGIVSHAERIARRGRNSRSVGEALGRIDTGAWTGPAADAWRAAHDSAVPRWLQAADSLDAAATALQTHAEILLWAQRRAADAVEVWNDAEQQTALTPPDPAADRPGEAGRHAATAMLDDARRRVAESARRTADVLRSEADAAPQDSQKQADANFYGGIWDSVYGAAAGAARAVVDPVGAAGAAVDAAAHPVRTARDMVAWDDWASGHGDRALGRVTGSAALAAVSFGAAKGASVLARRARERGGAEVPDGSTAVTPTAPVPDPLRPAIDYATREPKMDHVFVPKHKLEPLVARFGDRHAAMVEIVRRLGAGNDLPSSGPFEVVRQIEGQPVHIRGAVVNGTPKIGTVFTP